MRLPNVSSRSQPEDPLRRGSGKMQLLSLEVHFERHVATSNSYVLYNLCDVLAATFAQAHPVSPLPALPTRCLLPFDLAFWCGPSFDRAMPKG